MSWSVTPEAPARQYGPAWSTDPAPPPVVSRGGWFALVNYLIPFGGEGGLAASVVPHGAGVGELRGSGRLSATVSPRYALTAVFTGLGQALVQPTPARVFTAQLGAQGSLSAIINDGLHASVAPSFTIAAAFSGGGDFANASGDIDGLTASVIIGSTGGSALVDAVFDAAGNLTAQVFEADGLHASIYGIPGGVGGPTQLVSTFTQSSVYSANSAATYAGMNNGTADEASQTGTNSDGPSYVRADLGSTKLVDHIVIGYDYLNHLGGGWGTFYTESGIIQTSTDGSTWDSSYGSPPSYAGSGSSNGLVSIPIGANARYVQLLSYNYIAITELEVWGT